MNPTSRSNRGTLIMSPPRRTMTRFRCVTGAVTLVALLALAPVATAATATLTGRVSPDHGPPGTPLRVTVGFTLAPDAPGQSTTLSDSELLLPGNAVLNGRLFPVCTSATINARRGRFTSCPKGSQIGSGSFKTDVPNAEVFGVPGRVTIFNGGGTTLTVHVYATNPALVSEAFDARIVRTRGRYGYRMTISLPYTLQEISDGWFTEVRSFTATVGATIEVRGRTRGYVEATRCPRSGSVPIAGTFDFLRDSAPATALGSISCRP